jgi:hypothetical protein
LPADGNVDKRTMKALIDEEIADAREWTRRASREGNPNLRGYTLYRLASALYMAWERMGDTTHLEEALQVAREIAEIEKEAATSEVDHAIMENNLCFALAQAGEGLKRKELLDEAVPFCELAVRKIDKGSPIWPPLQHSLGYAHWKRYQLGRDPADLESAIVAMREAATARLSDGVDRCHIATFHSEYEAVRALQAQ